MCDTWELLYQAHRSGVVIETDDGVGLTVRGSDHELVRRVAAAKAEVLPFFVPKNADILLAVSWLGWPAVSGIAGTEAAWRAAARRMSPDRQVEIYERLEDRG